MTITTDNTSPISISDWQGCTTISGTDGTWWATANEIRCKFCNNLLESNSINHFLAFCSEDCLEEFLELQPI